MTALQSPAITHKGDDTMTDLSTARAHGVAGFIEARARDAGVPESENAVFVRALAAERDALQAQLAMARECIANLEADQERAERLLAATRVIALREAAYVALNRNSDVTACGDTAAAILDLIPAPQPVPGDDPDCPDWLFGPKGFQSKGAKR